MNYRHHYHAGNFADLVKHAALLAGMEALARIPGPLTVIDTHAGAGLYDLRGEMALKSGEAAAGVARLMSQADAPAVFAGLKAAVAQANPAGGLRFYPGSPTLIAKRLQSSDRLVAVELRPEDAQGLKAALGRPSGAVEVVVGDGFALAPPRTPAKGATFVLIDPPYERADDYDQVRRCVGAVLRRNPEAVVMIWTPLKDLETFDSLLRGLEDLDPPSTLVVETRLRPLNDPMRMNGCALVIVNPPTGLEAHMSQAAQWVAETLGDPGGEARIWIL